MFGTFKLNKVLFCVRRVRKTLLRIAKVSPDKYTVIPIPGSGTVATEAAVKTMFGPKDGKVQISPDTF